MRTITLLALAAVNTLLITACTTVDATRGQQSALSDCSATEGYPDCQEGHLSIPTSEGPLFSGDAVGTDDSTVEPC
jgi:hypothetical protein